VEGEARGERTGTGERRDLTRRKPPAAILFRRGFR
jgi:hypothetical protein